MFHKSQNKKLQTKMILKFRPTTIFIAYYMLRFVVVHQSFYEVFVPINSKQTYLISKILHRKRERECVNERAKWHHITFKNFSENGFIIMLYHTQNCIGTHKSTNFLSSYSISATMEPRISRASSKSQLMENKLNSVKNVVRLHTVQFASMQHNNENWPSNIFFWGGGKV